MSHRPAKREAETVLTVQTIKPFNDNQLKDHQRSVACTKGTDLPKGVTWEEGRYRVRLSMDQSVRLVSRSYPDTPEGLLKAIAYCEGATAARDALIHHIQGDR